MNAYKLASVAGAFFGLTAVITGAMGAHALEKVLSPDQLASYETAVRFQMFHALLLLIMGNMDQRKENLFSWSVWAILIGTILFSGSIYVLVLTPIKVGLITPLGGTILIIGWGILLIRALKK
ncbi:MAG: DUF423 domain-containing protein [Bacteroidetes bacterium]|nr:DUF423 domain-containing protein [Bacteroidota bacterium]